MEAFQTFTLEEIEPQIGLVTLNRPDQLNAINVAMLDDFNALFAKLAKDDAIRVLITPGPDAGFAPARTSTMRSSTRTRRPSPIRRTSSGSSKSVTPP